MADIGDQAGQRSRFQVEVAYARPERQEIIALEVEAGCTALEAVKRSGILAIFPEIDPESAEMGIFSKRLDGRILPSPAEYQLEPRDRVEIYRPLLLDPKEARLLRAARAKAKSQKKAKTQEATWGDDSGRRGKGGKEGLEGTEGTLN